MIVLNLPPQTPSPPPSPEKRCYKSELFLRLSVSHHEKSPHTDHLMLASSGGPFNPSTLLKLDDPSPGMKSPGSVHETLINFRNTVNSTQTSCEYFNVEKYASVKFPTLEIDPSTPKSAPGPDQFLHFHNLEKPANTILQFPLSHPRIELLEDQLKGAYDLITLLKRNIGEYITMLNQKRGKLIMDSATQTLFVINTHVGESKKNVACPSARTRRRRQAHAHVCAREKRRMHIEKLKVRATVPHYAAFVPDSYLEAQNSSHHVSRIEFLERLLQGIDGEGFNEASGMNRKVEEEDMKSQGAQVDETCFENLATPLPLTKIQHLEQNLTILQGKHIFMNKCPYYETLDSGSESSLPLSPTSSSPSVNSTHTNSPHPKPLSQNQTSNIKRSLFISQYLEDPRTSFKDIYLTYNTLLVQKTQDPASVNILDAFQSLMEETRLRANLLKGDIQWVRLNRQNRIVTLNPIKEYDAGSKEAGLSCSQLVI